MTITALPTPPDRQDPDTFEDRADAFLGALPQFGTELNLMADEFNASKQDILSQTVDQQDIGARPEQLSLNQHLCALAFMQQEGFVIKPQASMTPWNEGEMVVQLTSNTSLTFKVRGTDGVVRSANLILS